MWKLVQMKESLNCIWILADIPFMLITLGKTWINSPCHTILLSDFLNISLLANFVFWLCYVHFLFSFHSNYFQILAQSLAGLEKTKTKNVESCLPCFTFCFYCYLLLPIIPLFMPSLIKLVWLFSFFFLPQTLKCMHIFDTSFYLHSQFWQGSIIIFE